MCWQATDKALENSRLFGVTPCWSLWLASTGGILAKSFFTTVEKVEKIIFPLFFSVEMMATRLLVSKIGERNPEKERIFVKISVEKRKKVLAVARTLNFALK